MMVLRGLDQAALNTFAVRSTTARNLIIRSPMVAQVDVPGQHLTSIAEAGTAAQPVHTSLFLSRPRLNQLFNQPSGSATGGRNYEINAETSTITNATGLFVHNNLGANFLNNAGNSITQDFIVRTTANTIQFRARGANDAATELERFRNLIGSGTGTGDARPFPRQFPNPSGEFWLLAPQGPNPTTYTAVGQASALNNGPNAPGVGTARDRLVTPNANDIYQIGDDTIEFRQDGRTAPVNHNLGVNGTDTTMIIGDTDVITINDQNFIPAADFAIHSLPRIYPADRCTWIQEVGGDGRGYAVAAARFYPGAGTDVSIDIDNAALGFIGKSGRFVRIAD